MQVFDELAVDQHHAFAGTLGLGICRDDAARPGDLLRTRREGGIGRFDLLRVDQRLAVETELTPLATGERKTLVVRQIEMDAVQGCKSVCASSKQSKLKRRHQRQTIARVGDVQILGQIRAAEYQSSEPWARRRDRARV